MNNKEKMIVLSFCITMQFQRTDRKRTKKDFKFYFRGRRPGRLDA